MNYWHSLCMKQVLAATQTPGEAGMNWFQGTADAVRQFTWVFEVGGVLYANWVHKMIQSSIDRDIKFDFCVFFYCSLTLFVYSIFFNF